MKILLFAKKIASFSYILVNLHLNIITINMHKLLKLTLIAFLLNAILPVAAQVSSYTRPSITQLTKKFTSGGKTYTMYWVNTGKEDHPNSTNVADVYFVPADFVPFNKYRESSDRNRPPCMDGLIYHDLGPGKEFVGAVVFEEKYTDSTKEVEFWEYEIQLPEQISDMLMDLYQGRTKFYIGDQGRIAKMFKNLQTVQTPALKSPTLTKTVKM